MEASGADKGFFQEAPVLQNQFYDDESYQRCFRLFLSASIARDVEHELRALGTQVLSEKVFAWITDAERNKPYLKGSGRDAFGNWKGELVTGEGWRELQKFGLAQGMVAAGYDTPYARFSRPFQFLRLHLWEASSANVTCPSAMQDGAARLLQLQLESDTKLTEEQKRVFENAFRHLVSRDPAYAWTSGQWMTERPGGSDVSLTETTALYKPAAGARLGSKEENIPLGPWSISGFKWFSSATDSQMAILLARTSSGGLSTFLAPMRKHNPSATSATGIPIHEGHALNGVRIQRLKNKSGTQPLPTAELILDDMRAWMVGQEGQGIREISTVLTITRVHSAIGAMGYVGRGLAIARAYARVRATKAGTLAASSLHMRTLAGMTVEYRGLMLLSFFTCYILGASEHPPSAREDGSGALETLTPESGHIAPLLRVLTQLTKAYVCKTSVPLLFSCMECLGGIGYLLNEEQEYLNIARLFRDCSVLPIWEGTTDVLSTDFIRALKHPRSGMEALDALEALVDKAMLLESSVPKPHGWKPVEEWAKLQARILGESQAELMVDARDILWQVADLLVSVLLFVDAASDGDEASQDIFWRFVEKKYSVEVRSRGSAGEQLGQDSAIVYGRNKGQVTPKL